MRILYITPYPPSRIRVRSYGFLTQLQRAHEVTVMMLCTSERELADAEALRSQGYHAVVARESKRQAIMRSGLALASTRSLHVAYASSTRFTQAIQNLCAQQCFDVVHVEHLRGIAASESLVLTHPVVWDAVDCLSLLYQQTRVAGPNMPIRMLALLENRRTLRYESYLLNTLQHIVVSSARDRQAMIQLLPKENGDARNNGSQLGSTISVLPNGVDLDYFCPMHQERRPFNLVFSGKMSYHPNVATVLYLYQQIMPLIWQHRPEVTLTIAGDQPTKAIERLANDPRVEVTGHVDDIRPYIRRAEVMVCPMVYSAGIQNKVLEAMALGTPVVTATRTAEALRACPGRDLLVAESAEKFAEATLHILEDRELRTALSRCGRAYVESYHDWQVVTHELVSIYQNAIDTHSKSALFAF